MISWDEAKLKYETDATVTQASLARDLGVTPQAVSLRAKDWHKASGELVELVEQLPITSPKQGSELGVRSAENIAQMVEVYAMTGRKTFASGVIGIDTATMWRWCEEDPELAMLLSAERNKFLAKRIRNIAEAKDWKSDLKLLQAAKETEGQFADDKQKEAPTIILNIHRDAVVIE